MIPVTQSNLNKLYDFNQNIKQVVTQFNFPEFKETVQKGKEMSYNPALVLGQYLHSKVLGSDYTFRVILDELPVSDNMLQLVGLMSTSEIICSTDVPIEPVTDQIGDEIVSLTKKAYKSFSSKDVLLKTGLNVYYTYWEAIKAMNKYPNDYIISTSTEDKGEILYNNLLSNPTIKSLLSISNDDRYEVFSEKTLYGTEMSNIQLQGTLDRLIIDKELKNATVLEVKTCRTPEQFYFNYMQKGYYHQQGMYVSLTHKFLVDNYYKQLNTNFMSIDHYYLCVCTAEHLYHKQGFIPYTFSNNTWNRLGIDGGLLAYNDSAIAVPGIKLLAKVANDYVKEGMPDNYTIPGDLMYYNTAAVPKATIF